MKYLNFVDYGVITAYLLILLVIGQYLKKRASASVDNYFLAGRKTPEQNQTNKSQCGSGRSRAAKDCCHRGQNKIM